MILRLCYPLQQLATGYHDEINLFGFNTRNCIVLGGGGGIKRACAEVAEFHFFALEQIRLRFVLSNQILTCLLDALETVSVYWRRIYKNCSYVYETFRWVGLHFGQCSHEIFQT